MPIRILPQLANRRAVQLRDSRIVFVDGLLQHKKSAILRDYALNPTALGCEAGHAPMDRYYQMSILPIQ